MSKPQDRMISKRSDGTWANTRNDANRATSVHDTQNAAINAARKNIVNQGGGEISIQGRDNLIRRKMTIKPGNDPFPPRDRT